MPPKSLPVLAAELALANDSAAALRTVHEELADWDRHAGLALLTYDAHRGALINRADAARAGGNGSASVSVFLALDHLPPAVQYAVLAGQRFADVGDQAAQYARILGVELAGGTQFRMLVKGIVLEGALSAVLAAYDTRRRGAARLLDRAEPLAGLFELAYARVYEREARFEAVAALHDVTSRLRAEHASSVSSLEREVERLRSAQRAGTSDVVRELRHAVATAERRATTAEQRLVAVEEQVVSAVDRLERLHLQLHEQDEAIRARNDTIRKLEQRLAEQVAGDVGS